MARNFRELTMTPAVLARQKAQYGTTYGVESTGEPDVLGPAERDFIESRDTFYMATVTETGWPYVQHRGGTGGFLRVIDEKTIAFADLRGNRQLISTGNFATNDRVALILMDYPQQMRLKILGRVTIEEASANSAIAAAFEGRPKDGAVERFIVIRIDGFDWNCPQHITPRYTEAEVEQYVAPLRARIAELEAEVEKLRP
jgi:predicted pyridoxine 5'-phosphate oxidase superfamily flavin-nucleotide-binding protein